MITTRISSARASVSDSRAVSCRAKPGFSLSATALSEIIVAELGVDVELEN